MQAPLRVESGSVTTTRALTYSVSMNVEKLPVSSTKRPTSVQEKKADPAIALPGPSHPVDVPSQVTLSKQS